MKDTFLMRALTCAPRTLYASGVVLRTVLYEKAYLTTMRLARPVLSVGNITLGGTGKTPIVEMLAKFLRGQGYGDAVVDAGVEQPPLEFGHVLGFVDVALVPGR